MAIAQRVESLKAVGEIATRGGEFSYALRDFLDGFYEAPNRESLMEKPPSLSGIVADGKRLDAYLGAVAEHLCRMKGYRFPKWIAGPARFLETPWFAMKSHAGRMLLLMDSPSAFRGRNIFVSADALKRV